jgi:hypothetical protein
LADDKKEPAPKKSFAAYRKEKMLKPSDDKFKHEVIKEETESPLLILPPLEADSPLVAPDLGNYRTQQRPEEISSPLVGESEER